MFFPACDHCMRCFETPEQMAKRLAGYEQTPQLFRANELVPPLEKV